MMWRWLASAASGAEHRHAKSRPTRERTWRWLIGGAIPLTTCRESRRALAINGVGRRALDALHGSHGAVLSLQPHSMRKVRRPFMTVQCLRRVLTVTLVVGGAVAMATPRVQAQEVLPTEGGMVTLVGCFLPGGSHHSK